MVNTDVPTHRITHRNGWTAEIHIYASVQANLESKDAFVRNKARKSVCAAFRSVCERTVRGFNLGFVNWVDLVEVRPLTAYEMVQYQYDRTRGSVDPDGEGCDECTECDKGSHERCRSAQGCPIARNW